MLAVLEICVDKWQDLYCLCLNFENHESMTNTKSSRRDDLSF